MMVTMAVDKIIDKIDQVLRPVEAIAYAFLFGSALQRLLPQSDIDILIGGKLDFHQKLLLTAELSSKLSRNTDLIVVSEAQCELVLKAMSQGVLIFERNREILKQDYIRNWRCFDDNTSLRRIRFARIHQEYAYGR
jgi:predicted nucleotidyltransferase